MAKTLQWRHNPKLKNRRLLAPKMVSWRRRHKGQSLQKILRWLFASIEIWEEVWIWFCSESRQKGWRASLFRKGTKREIEIKKWKHENVFKNAAFYHDVWYTIREKLFKLWCGGIRRGISYLKGSWKFCWRRRELRLNEK